MRKSIIVVWLLCITVLACSCNGNNSIDINPNYTVDQELQNEIDDDVVMPSEIDRPVMTIESFKEYTKLVDSKKLSDSFVTYEKINKLGEFVHLVFLSDTQMNDYSKYMYSLVDASGYEFVLYVDENAIEISHNSTGSNISITSTDMRNLDKKASGTVVNNDLVYTYVSGELLSVSWVDNGISYKLCGMPTFSDYPATTSTFVGKLMNSDKAMKSFNSVFETTKDDR